ncbi:MAG: drug/metabolite exporter YedA [Gemmatimonadetes bacterium]|nr:drug/metabolite exporter YedA [Gemmatimonadota bacterium]
MSDSGTRPSRAAILLGFAAIYVIWGSTYLAIRYAVHGLPPFLMAGTRFFMAGVMMYGWLRARGAPRPSRANWKGAAIVGALLLVGGNGGVSWAEQRITSGLAALLVATAPLWMVLLNWGFSGKRPTGRVWLGLVVGFLGLAVLVGPSELLGGGAADALGAAAVIVGSLAWAAGSVISGRVELPRSPQLATAIEMLCGGALLILTGTLLGEWGRLDLEAVEWESWVAYVYLIFIGSLVAFSAYVWLLRHVEVAKVATYAYVNPVVAVLLGWLIAGEELTARILIAAAVIVAGVVVITSSRREAVAEKSHQSSVVSLQTNPD